MRLAGKVVFLTGGGGGLGREMCARFVAEGARVAIVDIGVEAAEAVLAAAATDADARARMVAIGCDITDAAAVAAAAARTVAAFGRIDVLCNNAGGSTLEDGAVTEASVDEFWRVIKLDLFGTFLCCKTILPHIIAAGGGAVINMSSIAAVIGLPGRDCYTAAKGGVAAMTRSMAVEYAPAKVRVNAIAPSVTLTPPGRRADGAECGDPAARRAASARAGAAERRGQPRRLSRLGRVEDHHRPGVPGRQRLLHPLTPRPAAGPAGGGAASFPPLLA